MKVFDDLEDIALLSSGFTLLRKFSMSRIVGMIGVEGGLLGRERAYLELVLLKLRL